MLPQIFQVLLIARSFMGAASDSLCGAGLYSNKSTAPPNCLPCPKGAFCNAATTIGISGLCPAVRGYRTCAICPLSKASLIPFPHPIHSNVSHRESSTARWVLQTSPNVPELFAHKAITALLVLMLRSCVTQDIPVPPGVEVGLFVAREHFAPKGRLFQVIVLQL